MYTIPISCNPIRYVLNISATQTWREMTRTSPVWKYGESEWPNYSKKIAGNLRFIGDCLVPAQASSPGKCFQCSGSWLGSRIKNIYDDIRIFDIFPLACRLQEEFSSTFCKFIISHSPPSPIRPLGSKRCVGWDEEDKIGDQHSQ